MNSNPAVQHISSCLELCKITVCFHAWFVSVALAKMKCCSSFMQYVKKQGLYKAYWDGKECCFTQHQYIYWTVAVKIPIVIPLHTSLPPSYWWRYSHLNFEQRATKEGFSRTKQCIDSYKSTPFQSSFTTHKKNVRVSLQRPCPLPVSPYFLSILVSSRSGV